MAGFFGVLVVALPGVKSGVLEGASEAKSDWPREGAVFDNFGEIIGGLFGGLTAGEKNDTGEICWNVIF